MRTASETIQSSGCAAGQQQNWVLATTFLVVIALYLVFSLQAGSGTAVAQSAGEEEQPQVVTNVIVDDTVPPTVVLPNKNAFAILGGADGRYYIVDWEGFACQVREDRRHDLYWRARHEEPTVITTP